MSGLREAGSSLDQTPGRWEIPAFDARLQYQGLKEELEEAVRGVFRSGEFILGPAVQEAERRVAGYCGCCFGVGVASGTDALTLALAAQGIGPGDEVITTPFTFIATASAISRAGARPVFVDIDPRTFAIDPGAIEARVGRRTRAIVPVHLFGCPADMSAIMDIATRHELVVIEDCAQAMGARFKSQRVASFGHASCLSFFPTKNLGAYGDAGMVVTDLPEVAERVDLLRRHGSRRKHHADVLGWNSRLDALQAAILCVKLPYLDSWNAARRAAAQRYRMLLDGIPVKTPQEDSRTVHVYNQFTIRAPDRDNLAAHLRRRGIGSAVYYPVPIHRQKPYKGECAGLDLPEADRAAREVLSLPMFPEITPEQQERVAAAVHEFYAE